MSEYGIKEYYNYTAKDWADEWYANTTLMPYLELFMSELSDKPRVLDLCCGSGYESMRLSKLGADVVGVDFSEESIKIAKEKNPEIEFHVDDMLNDYSNLGLFDGAAVIAGLVHLKEEDLEKAFENLGKVIKKDSLLFIVVRDGEGKSEKASTKTVDGIDFERSFYLYTRASLERTADRWFEFYKDVTKEEDSMWKYYFFRRK